jgi:hypothetical protein
MAAGAWVTPPDDNWRPEHTTAANDSSRVRDTLRAQLATVGLTFQIEPNPHTEEVNAAFRAWPVVTSRGATDEISVSILLWLALGIGVHPCRWIEEQYAYSESILHALVEAPGRVYFADGGYWSRGALPPAHHVQMSPETSWLWVPDPQQFLDAKTGLTWNMMSAGDVYEAAAQNPAGKENCMMEGVSYVSRTGSYLPTERYPGGQATDAYNSFWHALRTEGDTVWESWPYSVEGNNGIGDLPDEVLIILRKADFVPSHNGIFYQPNELCACGAFLDNGVVIPLFRLCEQADGCERLQILRYLVYILMHSEGSILWTPVQRAGRWGPDLDQCELGQTGVLVPLMFNGRAITQLLHYARMRGDYYTDLVPPDHPSFRGSAGTRMRSL